MLEIAVGSSDMKGCVAAISGLLVLAVGRFVMNDCGAESPATTTDVDVRTSVVVLGFTTGVGAGGGGGGRGGAATELSEVVIKVSLVINVVDMLDVVDIVDDGGGIVDDVDGAGAAPGRKGVTRLLRPLIPAHMIPGSVQVGSAMMKCCHWKFEYPLKFVGNSLGYKIKQYKRRRCTAASTCGPKRMTSARAKKSSDR